MKDLYSKEDLEYLKDNVISSFEDVLFILDNPIQRNDGYILADLVRINKVELDSKIEILITGCKELKKIKAFNPKTAK